MNESPFGMDLCLFSLKLWVDGTESSIHCFENKNFYLKEHNFQSPFCLTFSCFPTPDDTTSSPLLDSLMPKGNPLIFKTPSRTSHNKFKTKILLTFTIFYRTRNNYHRRCSPLPSFYNLSKDFLLIRRFEEIGSFNDHDGNKVLISPTSTQLIALWILIKKLLICKQKAFRFEWKNSLDR